jgi:hypothetical protein
MVTRQHPSFGNFIMSMTAEITAPPSVMHKDKNYACCKLCGQDIWFSGKTGTGGIRGHISG